MNRCRSAFGRSRRAWPVGLIVVVAWVALVPAAAPCFAQAGAGVDRDDWIRADRSSYGVSALSVLNNNLQIEGGIGITAGSSTGFDLPFNVRYGLSNSWELRAGGVALRAKEDSATIGLSRLTIGAKWMALHEKDVALALVPELEVNRRAARHEFTVPVVVALDLRLNKTFALTANSGVVFSDPIGMRLMAGLGARLEDEVLLSLEVTSFSFDIDAIRLISSLNLWLTVWIGSDFSLDVGVGKGLEQASDFTLEIGLSGRFG